MRKTLMRVLGLSLLGVVALALLRRGAAARGGGALAWEPQPLPAPPRPVPAPSAPSAPSTPPASSAPLLRPPTSTVASAAWVAPLEGECPLSHPLKAKVSSGIFHSPGGQSYGRTHADRCYADADAATADGLRAAKR